MKRIEGENTLVTVPMPLGADRVQYCFSTPNGRPLKAQVQMWVGPIRTCHTMDINSENGSLTPYRGTLKCKKQGQMLKIKTTSTGDFPMLAGVKIFTEDESKEFDAFFDKKWASSTPKKVQGGAVQGGGGAVRIFDIDPHVEAVHLMIWSKHVGKKSSKAKIEVLHGPNNVKQLYDFQCSGSYQPYHCILQTPGKGVSIRIYNKKFVEDGLFEAAVVPYVVGEAPDVSQPIIGGGGGGSLGGQWWS